MTGSDFARDIKKNTNVTDTVKRWFFFVKTNVLNDTVKLTFLKDRIPSSLGKYLTDLSTGQRVNLKTISEYKYYNTSATARQFELIIGDSTAPSLTMLYPLGSNIFRSGTTKNINWTTSDGTGIDSVLIYKSSDAGTNYSFLKSVGFSQSTTWTIPNEYLNNNYSIKIIARDSLGNTKTAKSLNTFTAVGDSLASTANAGWNLLSLPFIPNDSTTSKIFGDDFGSNPYYVWGYGYSTGYFTAPYLLQGKGYWLGSLSSTVWDLRGTALESDSTVRDLELGFNLIGNNYVRGISKNTLQFIKSGVQYSFTAAVTSGLISGTLYKYNGTGYSTSDTLGLFSGYWMGVLQTGVKMVQKPLPSTVTPLNPILTSPTPDNWELSLNASTSSQSDEISMIGVKPDATPEYDVQYDSPRPPRAPGSNYLELYFEHSGGNWPSFLGNKYAGDFISPSNPNWTFKVDCSQSNTALNIKWNKQYLISLGNDVSLTLTDNANNQSVNMKSDSIYTFTYNGIRTFTISSMITGISNTPEIPTEFAMNQNYPNPFNPVTTIKYQLPIAGFVTIKIYDMLGKEVVTLVNQDKQAGYYEVN
ncbi:MAG: T9SS type A sorting domain-containing protein, partial [Ignavibacteriae bacterium]|nr:T9SS type A sorting domain-containing protein [Ignavibacteriota bacterium]